MRAEGFAKCAEDYKDQKPGDENQIRVCRLGDPPLCLGLGDDRGWERSSNRCGEFTAVLQGGLDFRHPAEDRVMVPLLRDDHW